MTCETDEVSRYLALFYTMCRDFLINSDSGSIGDPITQQFMYGRMAPAFKVVGRSKYHKLSLDYVDNMSFRLPLKTLHRVCLSMHVLLFKENNDSVDYQNSRNHIDGYIEFCNENQKKPEAKSVMQVVTNTSYSMICSKSKHFVDIMYGSKVNSVEKQTKFQLTPNIGTLTASEPPVNTAINSDSGSSDDDLSSDEETDSDLN